MAERQTLRLNSGHIKIMPRPNGGLKMETAEYHAAFTWDEAHVALTNEETQQLISLLSGRILLGATEGGLLVLRLLERPGGRVRQEAIGAWATDGQSVVLQSKR